ncbi:MAG: hypothetical protein LBG81_06205 [Coriobacteriaceae bacterium]|jgi:hypothetical protein|nr:hypothetical protein [Coriobacteriaceae bacterium]
MRNSKVTARKVYSTVLKLLMVPPAVFWVLDLLALTQPGGKIWLLFYARDAPQAIVGLSLILLVLVLSTRMNGRAQELRCAAISTVVVVLLYMPFVPYALVILIYSLDPCH